MSQLSRRALMASAASTALVPGGSLAAEGPKRPFVLVHGSWHGAWCWRQVEKLLRAAGHEVFVPTLTGLAERAHLLSREVNLTTHVTDVANLLEVEELTDAVLVGHSYAGLVITGAGVLKPARVSRLVYLDAFVPAPGQSGFDLMPKFANSWREKAKAVGEGWWVPPLLDAKSMGITDLALAKRVDQKLTRMPVATFEQKLQFDEAAWSKLGRAYLRCAKFSGFGPTADKVRAAGWPVVELACGHDAMLAAPGELATELLKLAV